MSKKDISVTICTIGFISTENAIAAMDRFRPGVMSDLPLATPSDTALSIIKAGAQRWKSVGYPRMVTFVFTNLYNIMPETMCTLLRYLVWG